MSDLKIARKISFLIPYPVGINPGQRFRVEQYLDLLHQEGYTFTLFPFLNSRSLERLAVGRTILSVFRIAIGGFVRRLIQLPKIAQADFIFIYREATIGGPPLIEWILACVLKKRIIFDFDDAIWTTDDPDEPAWRRVLHFRSKVDRICRWSYKVSCGNDFLYNYARRYTSNAIVVPTSVDLLYHKSGVAETPSTGVTIGWTGSRTTLKYLKEIEEVLTEVENAWPQTNFLIIADQAPDVILKRMTFTKWSKANEIADLGKIDIGIMPLLNDEWCKGKCGFKAIQYMSMGIPAVVSNVGVNDQIVEDGLSGFVVNDHRDWLERLGLLIKDKALRIQMGLRARERIASNYSTEVTSRKFLSLFE